MNQLTEPKGPLNKALVLVNKTSFEGDTFKFQVAQLLQPTNAQRGSHNCWCASAGWHKTSNKVERASKSPSSHYNLWQRSQFLVSGLTVTCSDNKPNHTLHNQINMDIHNLNDLRLAPQGHFISASLVVLTTYYKIWVPTWQDKKLKSKTIKSYLAMWAYRQSQCLAAIEYGTEVKSLVKLTKNDKNKYSGYYGQC
jgi:hypothetical protein